jgi:putative oxidoreductase
MAQTIAAGKSSLSQPAWLTILRVVLGIILIWKGINFIRDTAQLKSMIEQTGIGVFSQSSGAIASVVSILSLLCGFFIMVGLFTKISCVVQLPIVFVAIVFVNMKRIEQNSFELILTIIVLVLLVLFVIKGSGPLSADEYFRRGAAFDRKESDTF